MSASNLQIYSIINLTINGIPAAEHASATIDQNMNLQRAKTVAKGFAGVTPGAAVTEVSIDMLLPVVGFEAAQVMLNTSMDAVLPVSFTFYVASNELVFNGFVESRSLSQAVDSEGKISFKAVGSYAAFQII